VPERYDGKWEPSVRVAMRETNGSNEENSNESTMRQRHCHSPALRMANKRLELYYNSLKTARQMCPESLITVPRKSRTILSVIWFGENRTRPNVHF